MSKLLFITIAVFLMSTISIAASESCFEADCLTAQTQVEVAPHWVYSGDVPANVTDASQTVTVAPHWVYTSSQLHPVVINHHEESGVAPHWVYAGTLPEFDIP